MAQSRIGKALSATWAKVNKAASGWSQSKYEESKHKRDGSGKFAGSGKEEPAAAKYPVKGVKVTKGQIRTIGKSLKKLNKNGTIARIVNEGEKQAAALGRKKS